MGHEQETDVGPSVGGIRFTRRHLVAVITSSPVCNAENHYVTGTKTANIIVLKTAQLKIGCYGQLSLENRKKSEVSSTLNTPSR
jgi:hypothetical protein